MRKVEDWLGRPIDLAESKSGVLAFVDPFGGLLRGDVTPWPPASVVQKLYSTRDFSGPDGTAVASSLGGYSDLQSVNSEDAITWSVFGPVAHSPPEVRKRFVAELFQAAEIQVTPGPATISLWRRIPHPETLGLGGPELDVMIQTPYAVVFVEAKWGSSVGVGQASYWPRSPPIEPQAQRRTSRRWRVALGGRAYFGVCAARPRGRAAA